MSDSTRVRTDELVPGDRVWHPFDIVCFTVAHKPKPETGLHFQREQGLRVTGVSDRGETVHVDVAPGYVWHRGPAATEAENERLRDETNRDEMQVAFEEHEARRHPVARKLLDENERLRARLAELEAATTTAYRAEHPDSGITLGHYGTESAARAHCEATERRSWPTGTTLAFDWIEDDEDRVAELVVVAGQNEESTTGYLVTALELASEYDEEADE